MGTDKLEEMKEKELGALLIDQSQNIGNRMRAVFFLRTIGSDEAVQELSNALGVKGDSVLLRHETAYVLGQLQNVNAIDVLTRILSDVEDDPVVRHEAGEAIGAIGHVESLELIEKFSEDERPEVSETCKIAAKRLKWILDHPEQKQIPDEEYATVDPAPPLDDTLTVADTVTVMMNTELPLFVRYQAMFRLRNLGGEDAVLGLAEGLKDKSALFRHEVAYVLGQMSHEASIPALQRCLEDVEEHGMVRHEAAEALGAVGTEVCFQLLEKFSKDPEPLVSESCVTALDSMDYWKNFEENA